jgi:hypothetical protein
MSNVIDLFPVKVYQDKKYALASADIVTLDSLDSRLSKAKNAHEYCMIASEIAKDIQSILQYHNVKA